MLQARGREMAKVRLIGIVRGTFPVTTRQTQSMLFPVRDLSALQQSEVGEVPFAVLLVRKFKQGVTVESMEAVHPVVICCP